MASKAIKGITVEIGGDTTKLSRALAQVDKQSRALSSELSEINQALKMDPGNTELLAQKQLVLAKAVETTRQRLDMLREAEKQVQAQFEKGDVSEDQVRALQREIITTTSKLEKYEQAAKETTHALAQAGDSAQSMADGTKKAEQGADDAANRLDDLADSAEKADDAGSGLGATLGHVAKVGLTALAGAVTAVVGALAGSAEASREYRTEMGKLDTAFTTAGHSSEAAQTTYKALQGVLGETDQAVEAANHLARLTDSEQDLATWTDIATGVYATFGDSLPVENLTEAANETSKTGQITGGLADALNWAGVAEDDFQAQLDACTTEQERQSLIMDTLKGLYSEAADVYRDTNAEVIRANEANEAWAASLAVVGTAIDPILTDVKSMGTSLLDDLLPGVTAVAEAFRGLLSGDGGANADLGAALSGIIAQLTDTAVQMAPVLVEIAMSMITSLTTTLLSMAPQLVTTGVTLVLDLITGLTQAIPQLTQALTAMIPQLTQALVTGIPQLIQAGVQLLSALLQAIPLMLPPLIEAMPQIVMAIINGLLQAMPQLLAGAVQFLLAIVDAIPQLIEMLVPAIPQIVTTLILGLLDMVPQLLDAAVTLLLALVEAIPQICVALIAALPQIWQTMANYLGQLPGKLWEILQNLISNFVRWGSESRQKMAEGAKNILNAVVNTIKNLPGQIWTWLQNAISRIVEFGANAMSRAKTAAKNIFDAIVNGIKSLPTKVMSIGSDLVRGLWNGINNMVSWVLSKIRGFTNSILSGIKSFFGVHSPSKETEWVGEMLDRGLEEGVLNHMDAPLKAMRRMAGDMLAEADLVNHMDVTGPSLRLSTQNGMQLVLQRLDEMLAAMERGQIITLDSKTLVGATADRYDTALGQRRVLAARGAL